jgi:hypothetical protein
MSDFSGYSPYIINKSFSYFLDTAAQANQMNMYPSLDKDMQFDYLYHTVRQMKRFSKWVKKIQDDDLTLISEYFKVNRSKAIEYKSFLSEEDLNYIKNMKGGTDDGNG